MFKPHLAEEYIDQNTDLILRLFSLYQLIEMTLFLKLFKSQFPSNLKNEIEFSKFSKKITGRTLGKIIKEYESRFPDDNFLILKDLHKFRKERNNFMHSMWIILAICKSKQEAKKHGDFMLNEYNDTATKLFDIVFNPNFLK